MITLYDLGNIQNKAQKAREKFEEKKMEEVSISVADTETRFWSYTNPNPSWNHFHCPGPGKYMAGLLKVVGILVPQD